MGLTTASINAEHRTLTIIGGVAEQHGLKASFGDLVRPVLVRGYVNSKNEAAVDVSFDRWPHGPSVHMREVVAAGGEWLAVFRDVTGGYLVAHDFFGFQSVWYAFIDEGSQRRWIIGDTFHGVRRHLSLLGHDSQIDWEVAAPHLLSNHTIFRTRASNKSFDRRIRLLAPGATISVRQTGWSIDLHDRTDPYGRSYSELVESGIGRGAAEMRAMFEISAGSAQFLLSGGKDSRAMLALAFAGGVEREVGISTEVPISHSGGPAQDQIVRDFDAACDLVGWFDLSWMRREHVVSEKMTVAEAVARWQRYRGNNSFQLRGGQSLVGYIGPAPMVQFIGIGGELFRAYLSGQIRSSLGKWWEQAGKGQETLREDLGALFESICPRGSFPRELYELARSHFEEAHILAGGRNVLSSLDAGYNSFRNCGHAGTGLYLRSVGIVPARPLAQPEFFWAAQLLGDEDRDDGRILYDLINAVEPRLHCVAYASPPWPQRFLRSTAVVGDLPHSRRGSAAVALQALIDDEVRKGVVLRRDRGIEAEDWKVALERKFKRNLAVLSEWAHETNDPLLEHCLERFVSSADFNTEALASALCVSESLLDVLDPPGSSVYTVELKAGDASQLPVHFDLVCRAMPGVDREELIDRVWERCTLSRLHIHLVKVEVKGKRPFAELRIDGVTDEFEVAVYWYKDGQKERVDWYGEERALFRFPLPSDSGGEHRIRGQVFIRRRDTGVILKYVSTGVLLV